MAQVLGSLDEFILDRARRIEEAGLTPAALDDVAPIAIYFFADLARKKQAEDAVRRLKAQAHPVLAGADGEMPRGMKLRDLEERHDKSGFNLLYQHAMATELARHLDASDWKIQIDQHGAFEIERNGETAFSGDADGWFAWYGDAAAVEARCVDLGAAAPRRR